MEAPSIRIDRDPLGDARWPWNWTKVNFQVKNTGKEVSVNHYKEMQYMCNDLSRLL